MLGLVLLLWAVFLVDACFRVGPSTWIVRPDGRHPLLRGGDFHLEGVGGVGVALLPWQRCYVTTDVRSADAVQAASLEREIGPLRFASAVLGLLLLVVLPALALRGALSPWWWLWLPLSGLALGVTTWLYGRARRRWSHGSGPAVWLLLLSPVSAVHAPHMITRHAFADRAPAVLIDALLDDSDLVLAFHRLWWDQPDQRDLIGQVVERRGLHDAWDAPPVPQGPGSDSYCPRCRVLFRADVLHCPDCDGIALLPLPGHPLP